MDRLPPLHGGGTADRPSPLPSPSSPPGQPKYSYAMSPVGATGSPVGSYPQADEREVVSSNMNERLQRLLDLLQLAPPIPSNESRKPARDPDLPPSPKPLFGTRPPPAALALSRGFSLGTRQDAREREAERAAQVAALQAANEQHRPSSPNTPGSAPSSLAADSPYAHLRQKKDGPLCSGWLSLQKNAGKWKRYWCEYASDGMLSYRVDDTTKKPVGTIQVTYCEAEITQLAGSQLNPLRKPPEEEKVTDALAQMSLIRSATTPMPGSSSSSLPAIGNSAATPASTPFVPPQLLCAPQLQMSKFDELYWRYLEEEQAFWCFKICSPNRVYLFKSDNPGTPAAQQAAASSPNPAASSCGEEMRNFFVLTIRNHIQSLFAAGSGTSNIVPLPALHFGDSPRRSPSPPSGQPQQAQPVVCPQPQMFKQKNDCVVELNPLLHEQFIKQTERYRALQQALNKQGFHEDELPITSVRKEKSGVLAMEQAVGSGEKEKPSNSSSSTGGAASSSSASSSSSSSSASSSVTANGSPQPEEMKWRDYYFVLFEGALFYYKDSKSTTPTGFISLRFASLVVDPKRLSRQEYVFHVVTPLRTICCRTKHAVALSEWISVLQHALVMCAKNNPPNGSASIAGGISGNFNLASAAGVTPPRDRHASTPLTSPSHLMVTPNGRSKRGGSTAAGSDDMTPNGGGAVGTPGSESKSSLTMLQNINKWINSEISSSIDNFQSMIQHPMGLEYFRKALREEEGAADNANANGGAANGNAAGAKVGTSHAHLDFYLAVLEFTNLLSSPTPPTAADAAVLAHQIFDRFLTPTQPTEFLSESTEDQRGMIEDQLDQPPVNLFDPIRTISIAILNGEFSEFKRTPEYQSLNEILNKNVVEDKREIAPFEIGSIQQFLIKVKNAKRSKEVRLEKETNVHTIGRDKSNMLVIEDSRVSRSHARVEYSATQCEYIDLGSSCGSKLNGKPVLRAKLRPGDVIELGQSVLIFQVKKKKSFKDQVVTLFTK